MKAGDLVLTAGTLREMICEGPCNPTIKTIDALRAKYRDPADIPLSVLSDMRKLRHAPHVALDDDLFKWQCQRCQQVRT
jgi:hypothetical protein